ncbi:MAG: hypothetical protein GC158_04715 [Cyanobacteria bacterium RI_101]|nr:hypothetical protein [Cyanobacteria bacterium RI_101]
MQSLEDLFRVLPRCQRLWEQLDALLATAPAVDNAYFLQSWQSGEWAERLPQAQILDWRDPENVTGQLAELKDSEIRQLLILGLESDPLPQQALTQLALLKEQIYPNRPFHWLVAVAPSLGGEFQGLLSFLDGKSYWFDFCCQPEEWGPFLEEWVGEFWLRGLPWQENHRLADFQGLMKPLVEQVNVFWETLSPLDRARWNLLRGLYQESLFLQSSPDSETALKRALDRYQDSWRYWREQGEGLQTLWLGLRLVYVHLLLIAQGSLDKARVFEDIQGYLKESFLRLKERQGRDFRSDSLELWGMVLRELENWEALRSLAELYLVFLYQLSPEDASGDATEPSWSQSQLQTYIAATYGLLTEALIEQWRFDEAKEAIKRAFENFVQDKAYPNLEPWLYYLLGRCLLGQDFLDRAYNAFHYALQKFSPQANPRLYQAILVELRECCYQQQLWEEVLKIDRDYQAWDYLLGRRNCVGAQPLPCLPDQRSGHGLAHLGVLFFLGACPFYQMTDISDQISDNPLKSVICHLSSEISPWLAALREALKTAPLALVVGEPGTGKRSLLSLVVQPALSAVILHHPQEGPPAEGTETAILGGNLGDFFSAEAEETFWPPLLERLEQGSLTLIAALSPGALPQFWQLLAGKIPALWTLLPLPPSWRPPAGAKLGGLTFPEGYTWLDWHCLGSELEDQPQKDSQPLPLWRRHVDRLLQPLSAPLQSQGRNLLEKLALTPEGILPRKTFPQLCPHPAPETPRLLAYLLQTGLLIQEFDQYRLATPLLAEALRPAPEKAEPPTIPGVSRAKTAAARQFAVTTHTKKLLRDLDPKSTAAEQILASKLQDAEQQYQNILEGIRLERSCFVILRQFESQALESLVAALQVGQSLAGQIKADTPWMDYPSLGPLQTLQQILDQIQERNRLQHRKALSCLDLSPDGKLILTAAGDGKARLWSWDGALLKTLRGHQSAVTDVQFQPKGKYIVTASADQTARLWDLEGQKLATLRGHEDWLRSARFSPRHEFIVTASRDCTLRIWNFAGEELVCCRGHKHWVRTAEFSADGQTILSASRDGTARLWDLEGREIAAFKGHTSWVRSAEFSPDGSQIITASADGTARVWTLDGKCVLALKGHQNWIRSAQWSADGERILTASTDGTARLWSREGKLQAILQGHQGGLHSACFSPDGQSIVTAAADGAVRLWNLAGKCQRILRGHQKDVYDTRFGADGERLVSISADHTARIWDLGAKQSVTLQGHENWVRQGQFRPQGDRVVTASRDQTARIWDLAGRELAVLRGHQDWVRSARFSPDGQWIATASADKTGQIWNLAGEKQATLRGHQEAVLSIDWSQDSQYLLTASKDGAARVWNRQGQGLAVLRGREASIFTAQFSPDAQFIATAGADHTARIWDIVGRELAVCQGHQGPVYSLHWNTKTNHLLTASGDGTARVWDFLGKELVCLRGHQSMVYEAQWSPDGQLIATAGADQTARLWDKTGRELAALYGHQGLVSTAQWSPDGQLIVTAGVDGTARLWDRLGRELAAFSGHQGWIRSAVFSPDGRWVLTASIDGLAKLWPVRSLSQLVEEGRRWLEDYLLHNPLVKESDRALAYHHPTLGDTESGLDLSRMQGR